MYVNLVRGTQDGFNNITNQIRNVSSDLQMTREEMLGRFNHLNSSLAHYFPDIFNHSGLFEIIEVVLYLIYNLL